MELNEILKIALKGGASDIHLKSGLPPMFRITVTTMPSCSPSSPTPT